MEDQPTDTGDLTTDADQASSTAAARGRHRMPSGKRRRAAAVDDTSVEETNEVEPVSSVDEPVEEPAEPAESAEATPQEEEQAPAEDSAAEPNSGDEPKPRRRWKFLRRKKNHEPAGGVTEQPPAADPVDAEPTNEPETVEPTPEVDAASDETGGDTTPAETEADAAAESTVAEEPVLVPHRPAGKRLKIAAAAAAVLFVAGGAFLGATAQPVIANRALVETKLDIARTAANAITTLWSYTPENMDSLAERSARYLTGDFAFQYRKFIDSIVATNKQAQVTNTTSVLGTAVESVDNTEASAVVYTNSVATSPVSKNIPSLRYLSYRLEMKRDRSDWRITRMTTITTLDLTPQL